MLEVRPVKEDPQRLFQGTRQGYQGERLSLNFQNVDVRSLLQVIADFTNLNIITSDSVGGTITLRLKDVPWDQALDIILQSKGLDMRKNGNVLLVAPRDEIATKEKLELESRNQIQELEPLRSEAFVVNYQKADEVRRLLVDDKQRLLSKRGSVAVDPRTNQMFVQDTACTPGGSPPPAAADRHPGAAGADRGAHRRGRRQVLAQPRRAARAARPATRTARRHRRVRHGQRPRHGSATGPGGTVATTTGAGTGGGGSHIDQPDQHLQLRQPAGHGYRRFQPGRLCADARQRQPVARSSAEVSALEQDGLGKVISSPRVVTADKVKAVIEQGTEIPYQQATSSGATSVAFRKAVLKLEVTPQITPEGAIFMDVKVNKDTRGQETTAGPAIDTKAVQTQVLVENGGTVVLGGIYEQSERTQTTKVPWLGDIPYLGLALQEPARSTTRLN